MVKEEIMEGGRRIVREIRRIGTSEGNIEEECRRNLRRDGRIEFE